MGRAPCCEKMGLKRGPWTPEEDRVLVSYIERYGHENWRALPKLAGLLRCGKSCRLRWINYLRPNIKRGNFTKEEEETIIKLHEMLGNRWSAIAARLPGRTDNEIKNVWHTHLKKRLNTSGNTVHQSASPARSCSDSSSSASPSEIESSDGKEEGLYSSLEEFPDIDESFWTEALSMDMSSLTAVGVPQPPPSGSCSTDAYRSFDSSSSEASGDDDLSFWLRVFMESGVVQDLPDIMV